MLACRRSDCLRLREQIRWIAGASQPDGSGLRSAPLRIGGAVILSGVVTSTVLRIEGRWRPVDRPFLVFWRDEYGKKHLDRAGDFSWSVSKAMPRLRPALQDGLTRSVTAACAV